MIKIVAVISRVEGKVKGGIQLRREKGTDADLEILGKALQSAMSMTLQYYQKHYLQGEAIEPDEVLRSVAADIADNLGKKEED